uniref:AAA+ ATPase domain-containing protein n=1 Tax=Globisporangium ultimum (strain ATCC 200006 / CBS 805.95 / DAOM BR144) TaxID=431595 RepID=K3W9K6_GLOUD
MSSSTAIEFGLINTFRTNNVVVDTMLCMMVPLLIQRFMTYMQGTQQSIFTTLYNYFFHVKDASLVTRVIEITQRFNQYGKVWDYEQKNHLLQKAISIYLSDILTLKNMSAQYELLEKKKKKQNRVDEDIIKSLDDDDSRSVASSMSTEVDDDDEDDDFYYGEVSKLAVEAMPTLNEWIDVEEGVQFMHEIETPESGGETKGLKETKVKFKFQSSLPDASDRIDAIIEKAFNNYRESERKKHIEDKSRYFYIQAGTKGTSSESETSTVAYKRYALGEEKTFDNLFFEEKEQVLQLLDNFTNKSGKFAIKGFPYKLGLLLHGPPGTGKTSLIKAVAQYTKRHIVTISLGKIKTNQELLDALFDMKFAVQGLDTPIEMAFEDVVFVMEDIDCASSIVNARKSDENAAVVSTAPTKEEAEGGDEKLMSAMVKAVVEDEKKHAQRNDHLNLSGLLNVLDGVIDCPGRIVIMTTNHPEKLDPALVRPGRVNKKLLLSYMGATQIQQMIEYYCTAMLTSEQSDRLHATFAQADKQFTPAEIEELCAEFDDVESILDGLQALTAPSSLE